MTPEDRAARLRLGKRTTAEAAREIREAIAEARAEALEEAAKLVVDDWYGEVGDRLAALIRDLAKESK